jgi:hypothetical protein
MDKYIVEIVGYQDDAVVKSIPCLTEREAARTDAGVNINLDHENYFTRIAKLSTHKEAENG